MTRWKLQWAVLAFAGVALAEDAGETIRLLSERQLMEESIAAEQARARAQSRSDYGLELRPRVTNEDVGVALRVYLPERWSKASLRERLALVAESEQLRVSALEWDELMEVYRLFCVYRARNTRLALYEQELESLSPYLEKANEGVALNQLAVTERAKLYSIYLDMVNDHESEKAELLINERELRLLVGADADLARMAKAATVKMPPPIEFNSLVRLAMKNRSDYKQLDVEARSLTAAESLTESEDGFRLKYIQPAYDVNYNNGESSYGLSASFILPWGTKNPDILVYQQQRELVHSEMALRRLIMEHRLRVLLKSATDYQTQAQARAARLKPLLSRLAEDTVAMDTGRLEDLRDLLLVRERILDVQLGTADAVERKERIAVELAAELGSLAP